MVTSKELSLIKELRKNSRQPLTEVGKALSIPPGSLHSLVKRLGDQGIVRRYVSLVDFSRLGYLIRISLCISVNEGGRFQEFMMSHPSVNSLYKLTGSGFWAELVFVDMLELEGFLEGLERFGVQERDVFHLVEEFKNEGFELGCGESKHL